MMKKKFIIGNKKDAAGSRHNSHPKYNFMMIIFQMCIWFHGCFNKRLAWQIWTSFEFSISLFVQWLKSYENFWKVLRVIQNFSIFIRSFFTVKISLRCKTNWLFHFALLGCLCMCHGFANKKWFHEIFHTWDHCTSYNEFNLVKYVCVFLSLFISH